MCPPAGGLLGFERLTRPPTRAASHEIWKYCQSTSKSKCYSASNATTESHSAGLDAIVDGCQPQAQTDSSCQAYLMREHGDGKVRRIIPEGIGEPMLCQEADRLPELEAQQ